MMSLRMWYLCTDAAHMRTALSLPLSFIFLRVSPPFFPFSSCVICARTRLTCVLPSPCLFLSYSCASLLLFFLSPRALSVHGRGSHAYCPLPASFFHIPARLSSFFSFLLVRYLFVCLRVEGQRLRHDVRPCHTGEASKEEAGGELGPALGRLGRVADNGTSGERLVLERLFIALELCDTVHGEAGGEDEDEPGTREASGDLGRLRVAERAEFDERPNNEKSVCESDFHAPEQRRHGNTVCRQVGQVVRHNRARRDRRLQHTHERVSIQRLHHLLQLRPRARFLRVRRAHTHAPPEPRLLRRHFRHLCRDAHTPPSPRARPRR